MSYPPQRTSPPPPPPLLPLLPPLLLATAVASLSSTNDDASLEVSTTLTATSPPPLPSQRERARPSAQDVLFHWCFPNRHVYVVCPACGESSRLRCLPVCSHFFWSSPPSPLALAASLSFAYPAQAKLPHPLRRCSNPIVLSVPRPRVVQPSRARPPRL